MCSSSAPLSADIIPPFTPPTFLFRLHRILKDFCGLVSEDSLKTNIILVYEILDEYIVRHDCPVFIGPSNIPVDL